MEAQDAAARVGKAGAEPWILAVDIWVFPKNGGWYRTNPWGFPVLKMINTWGVKWGKTYHFRKPPYGENSMNFIFGYLLISFYRDQLVLAKCVSWHQLPFFTFHVSMIQIMGNPKAPFVKRVKYMNLLTFSDYIPPFFLELWELWGTSLDFFSDEFFQSSGLG